MKKPSKNKKLKEFLKPKKANIILTLIFISIFLFSDFVCMPLFSDPNPELVDITTSNSYHEPCGHYLTKFFIRTSLFSWIGILIIMGFYFISCIIFIITVVTINKLKFNKT